MMQPTITVNAQQAYARFANSGIPEQVRNNLRRLLPPLGKEFGASVESKVDNELKSRNSITIKKEMIERAAGKDAIFIKISMLSPSANGLLPTYLEEGTKPHKIIGNPWLVFFWEKVGHMMFIKAPNFVNHPGTRAYRFMERTLAEQETNIVETLDRGVKGGLRR